MILDFFRQNGAEPKVPEQKASATGRVAAWHGAGRVAWSPRDTVTLTRTGFSGNPVGFRCVKMVAEAAASRWPSSSEGAEADADDQIIEQIDFVSRFPPNYCKWLGDLSTPKHQNGFGVSKMDSQCPVYR